MPSTTPLVPDDVTRVPDEGVATAPSAPAVDAEVARESPSDIPTSPPVGQTRAPRLAAIPRARARETDVATRDATMNVVTAPVVMGELRMPLAFEVVVSPSPETVTLAGRPVLEGAAILVVGVRPRAQRRALGVA